MPSCSSRRCSFRSASNFSDCWRYLASSGVSGSASVTTTATAATGVGSAALTAAVGTLAAANYSFTTFVDGTLTIYQSNNRSDLTALVNGGAPIAASDNMFVTTLAHVAGGNGTQILVPILAPFVNFVLQNIDAGAAVSVLRLHIEATE